MQIAIDGPAGSGKSTIAKLLAKKYSIIYLDTGAMYRSIAYGVLQAGIDAADEDRIVALAEEADLTFDRDRVFLNGEEVTQAIRTPEVSALVSPVSAIAGVRRIMVEKQRAIAGEKDVVMDGRDIASVVLPEAEVKIYLDASIAERARRREKDLAAAGTPQDLAEIEESIARRDYLDSNRAESPLIQVPEATVIDTTGKSIDDVVEIISERIDAANVL